MQKPPKHVAILDIKISRLGFEAALHTCQERVKSKQGGYVCFANVHTVTESQSDAALHRALNDSFLSVADGLPLVWLSRAKALPIASRVCGPDFMAEFLKKFPLLNYGLIGGAPGQAEKLAARYGIKAVCYSPPMRPFSAAHAQADWVQFLQLCSQKAPPDVVWVGLGAPKQELWMHEVSTFAPTTLFFGVGAAFDFLTLAKQRAPEWMQKSGMEWFFRLTQEPGRLWKRYLLTNTVFVGRVIEEFIRGKT